MNTQTLFICIFTSSHTGRLCFFNFSPSLILNKRVVLSVSTRPRWPCRFPTSLLQDQRQYSSLPTSLRFCPITTPVWSWTLWRVIKSIIYFFNSFVFLLTCSIFYFLSICLPVQWYLWTLWARRIQRVWWCWSRQRTRAQTTDAPWSLSVLRGPRARSPPPPRRLNARHSLTTPMEDWGKGGEELAVSPNHCPTNHRTYRYTPGSKPGYLEIRDPTSRLLFEEVLFCLTNNRFAVTLWLSFPDS